MKKEKRGRQSPAEFLTPPGVRNSNETLADTFRENKSTKALSCLGVNVLVDSSVTK